jgi:hypothetical protein
MDIKAEHAVVRSAVMLLVLSLQHTTCRSESVPAWHTSSVPAWHPLLALSYVSGNGNLYFVLKSKFTALDDCPIVWSST